MPYPKRLTIIFSDNLRLRCLFDGNHAAALTMARKIARTRGTSVRLFAYIHTRERGDLYV